MRRWVVILRLVDLSVLCTGKAANRSSSVQREPVAQWVDFHPDGVRPHQDPRPSCPRSGPYPDPPSGRRVRSDPREPGRTRGDRGTRHPLSGTRARLGERFRTARHRRRPARRGGRSPRAGTRPPRGRRGPGKRKPERSGGQGAIHRIGLLRCSFGGGAGGRSPASGARPTS